MEAIYMRNNLIETTMETLFTVFPDDKHINDISPPYIGFKLRGLQKSFL